MKLYGKTITRMTESVSPVLAPHPAEVAATPLHKIHHLLRKGGDTIAIAVPLITPEEKDRFPKLPLPPAEASPAAALALMGSAGEDELLFIQNNQMQAEQAIVHAWGASLDQEAAENYAAYLHDFIIQTTVIDPELLKHTPGPITSAEPRTVYANLNPIKDPSPASLALIIPLQVAFIAQKQLPTPKRLMSLQESLESLAQLQRDSAPQVERA